MNERMKDYALKVYFFLFLDDDEFDESDNFFWSFEFDFRPLGVSLDSDEVFCWDSPFRFNSCMRCNCGTSESSLDLSMPFANDDDEDDDKPLFSFLIIPKLAISRRISLFDSSSSLSLEWMLSFWLSKLSRALSISFNCASNSSTSSNN